MRSEHIVVDIAAGQHLGQLVSDQFANAQLALRWTAAPVLAGAGCVVP